nr:PaaI family thioesterase [Sphingomonas sp. CDS-1]
MMGIRYRASGLDWTELTMDLKPMHCQSDGIVADGAIITLVDMAATVAVWVRLGRFAPHATIDLRLDTFAEPPSEGAVTAHASCCPISGDVACVVGAARSRDGRSFAQFAATYKLLPQ